MICHRRIFHFTIDMGRSMTVNWYCLWMNRSRYLGFYFMIQLKHQPYSYRDVRVGEDWPEGHLKIIFRILLGHKTFFFSCLLQLDITLLFYTCPLLIEIHRRNINSSRTGNKLPPRRKWLVPKCIDNVCSISVHTAFLLDMYQSVLFVYYLFVFLFVCIDAIQFDVCFACN